MPPRRTGLLRVVRDRMPLHQDDQPAPCGPDGHERDATLLDGTLHRAAQRCAKRCVEAAPLAAFDVVHAAERAVRSRPPLRILPTNDVDPAVDAGAATAVAAARHVGQWRGGVSK